jgi:hypothetical protein
MANIPQTNPLNSFGGTPVFEGAAIVSTLTAERVLEADGSNVISLINGAAVAGTLNVFLPYQVDSSGAVTYLALAGLTRQIINSTTDTAAARRFDIQRVDTVDGSGNPATSTSIAVLRNPSEAGLPTGTIIGISVACNGSTWFASAYTGKIVP